MLTDPVGWDLRRGTEMTLVTCEAKDNNTALEGRFFSGCLPLEPSPQPASAIPYVGRLGFCTAWQPPQMKSRLEAASSLALEVPRPSLRKVVKTSLPCGPGDIAVVTFARCTLPHDPSVSLGLVQSYLLRSSGTPI